MATTDPENPITGSPGSGSVVAVSASTIIQVANTASATTISRPPTDLSVSAQSRIGLSATATEQVTTATIRTIAVGATSGLNLPSQAAGSNLDLAQVYCLAASSRIGLAAVGLAMLPPQTRAVAATTTVMFTPVVQAPSFLVVGATSRVTLTANPGSVRSFTSTASTAITLADAGAGTTASGWFVSASSRIGLTGSLSVAGQHTYYLAAAGVVALADQPGLAVLAVRNLSLSSFVQVADTAGIFAERTIAIAASTRLQVSDLGSTRGVRSVAATTQVAIRAATYDFAEKYVTATSGLALATRATSGREINVSAVTAVGMASSEDADGPVPIQGTSQIAFAESAAASIGTTLAGSTVRFGGVASAYTVLPDGEALPAGEANLGLRKLTYGGVSGHYPFSFAESPDGTVLIANGVDPMILWDGLSGVAVPAGLAAPVDPVYQAGSGLGLITGKRIAFTRWIDGDGNPSNLGPVSNLADLGRDGGIEVVSPTIHGIVVTSPDHGILAQDHLWIGGVEAFIPTGFYPVARIDDHTFLVPVESSLTSNDYAGGGFWVWGCAEVYYRLTPEPVPPNACRRQILRNTDGDDSVVYVDIDTADLLATEFASTLDDEALSACDAVPLQDEGGLPFSAQFEPPPANKAVVVNHQGRVFAAVDPQIREGNVVVTLGSDQVRGIATDWRPTLAGRWLYVDGTTRPYEIVAVDPVAQVATLAEPYGDVSRPYARSVIRSAVADRKVCSYSEAGNPAAWPPWFSFAAPEDGDELTGLLVFGSFLCLVERRHVYRLTYQDDPAAGLLFLAAERGCVNQRCLVATDQAAFLLDEVGIWRFDGSAATPISDPIQDVFCPNDPDPRLAVDWAADRRLWHAAHDATRATIRWFVHFADSDRLDQAICYDYRQARWWIEQYPYPVTSSTVGEVAGLRRSFVGSSARRVFCLAQGMGDGVQDAAIVAGTVGSATATSLTDPSASFIALLGAPVAIVAGTGYGQRSTVIDFTATTLTVLEPWVVVPDTTSRYQVGGVDWSWRSGWFEYLVAEENENPRDVGLLYRPTRNPVSVDVACYLDYDDDPESYPTGVQQDGVTITPGSSHIAFDLQRRPGVPGWNQQQFTGHGDVYGGGVRFVSLKLAGSQGAEPVQISRVALLGVED